MRVCELKVSGNMNCVRVWIESVGEHELCARKEASPDVTLLGRRRWVVVQHCREQGIFLVM